MTGEFEPLLADHHTILLADVDAPDWPAFGDHDAVLSARPPLGVWLHTGVHTGDIGVRFTVHDTEPPLDEAQWPHHDQVTLFLQSTEFHAINIGGGYDTIERTLPAPGECTVRAAWNRRAREDHNEFLDDGEELYVIDVWPAR